MDCIVLGVSKSQTQRVRHDRATFTYFKINSNWIFTKYQFSSVQSLSCVQLFVTPWTAARQASLSVTNSQRLLKLMSIESVMPSNHLILCCPLLLQPSIIPSIRVFSNESVLCISGQHFGHFSYSTPYPINTLNLSPLISINFFSFFVSRN